jgi:lipopolysaccharide heptosyltransferase I
MTEPALRFLIVRLSSMGDIVHALPAAAALAESFPRAEVHWVVEKRHAGLLRGNPHLRHVIVLDTFAWRRHLTAPDTWHNIRAGVRDLRQTPYTAAIDFQGLWKSAVVAWLSRAQERIGFAASRLREPSAGVLYTQQVAPPEHVHVVRENLALVERLGARPHTWRFPLPHNATDDAYIQEQLLALDAKDFIIVNPGGGWRAKCWSPQNYAALVQQLAARRREAILLTGSPAEESMIREIVQGAGSDRARYLPTTVVQFIALARRARLFIGGDTGPLHLAAAVGTPIVGIYGPTDPVRNGPFAAEDITLSNHGPINYTRRGQGGEYLSGIEVEAVAAAAAERMARAHA